MREATLSLESVRAALHARFADPPYGVAVYEIHEDVMKYRVDVTVGRYEPVAAFASDVRFAMVWGRSFEVECGEVVVGSSLNDFMVSAEARFEEFYRDGRMRMRPEHAEEYMQNFLAKNPTLRVASVETKDGWTTMRFTSQS